MTNDKPKQENAKLISVTTETRRFDIKQCPQCLGTRKMTIYKEYTHEEIPCITCLGEGYVAAPAPEDKPRHSVLEALETQLREQSENNADLFRQMEAEAHRADELETELAAARAEIVRLRDGIENMRLWAQTSPDISNKAYRIIGENTKALLNSKEDD